MIFIILRVPLAIWFLMEEAKSLLHSEYRTGFRNKFKSKKKNAISTSVRRSSIEAVENVGTKSEPLIIVVMKCLPDSANSQVIHAAAEDKIQYHESELTPQTKAEALFIHNLGLLIVEICTNMLIEVSKSFNEKREKTPSFCFISLWWQSTIIPYSCDFQNKKLCSFQSITNIWYFNSVNSCHFRWTALDLMRCHNTWLMYNKFILINLFPQP